VRWLAIQSQVGLASSTARIAVYVNSSATASANYVRRALTSGVAVLRELLAGSSTGATFVLPRTHVSEVSALERCKVTRVNRPADRGLASAA
jgi:hypothetical protein